MAVRIVFPPILRLLEMHNRFIAFALSVFEYIMENQCVKTYLPSKIHKSYLQASEGSSTIG